MDPLVDQVESRSATTAFQGFTRMSVLTQHAATRRPRRRLLAAVSALLAVLAACAPAPPPGAPRTASEGRASPGAAAERQGTTRAAAQRGTVIAAVGDMACDPADPRFNDGNGTKHNCAAERTSDAVLDDDSVEHVLLLGDYQYYCSDPADWKESYDLTWGRLDLPIYPVAGNHEYLTGPDTFGDLCPAENATAEPYFDYFGSAAHPETRGHYSFDMGNWHLIGLNSNCNAVDGCGLSSVQTIWLKLDLAANAKRCVLAFWHQPLFRGQGSGIPDAFLPWWIALYEADADVVLNGHVHNYQRYPPLDPEGFRTEFGITQYTVGTGGEDLTAVQKRSIPAPVAWEKEFGYLRMTLLPTRWIAEFVSYEGKVLDKSSGTCHT